MNNKTAIECSQKISDISVRDDATYEIVKDVFHRDCAIVCDPTLLLNKDDYNLLIKDRPDLFGEQARHELPEQLAHYLHALGASRHILGSVAHSEKHSFDATGARRVVQLRIAVGYIADADESGLSLRLVDSFLEAVKTRHAAEGKTF